MSGSMDMSGRRARGVVFIAAIGAVCAFAAPTAAASSHEREVGVVDLGLLPGGTASMATFVGDDGTVVGQATAADGYYHAVRWHRNGRIVDLGTLPGHTQSQVTALNRAGDLVGISNAPALVPNSAVRWDRHDRDQRSGPGS